MNGDGELPVVRLSSLGAPALFSFPPSYVRGRHCFIEALIFCYDLQMPKGMHKVFIEVISFKVTPDQKTWLENKAIEQTRMLGKEVTQTMVLRALIQQQIDLDEEKRKIWDAEIQISSAV
jgi:hypothetical protein